jgi:hypothetical protein
MIPGNVDSELLPGTPHPLGIIFYVSAYSVVETMLKEGFPLKNATILWRGGGIVVVQNSMDREF